MKWGIRKDREPSSKNKLTPEQKKRAIKVVSAMLVGGAAGAFGARSIAGMTDLALSPTAMLGGSFGASTVASLFED